MKCPGQSTRYWRPEDVFEVPCPECSTLVEFFKDDGWRRCEACGHLLRNPRLAAGCGDWCPGGEQCKHGRAD
jgi:hypothetical protein